MNEGWQESPLESLTELDSPITYGVVKPGAEGHVRFVRGGDLSAGKVLDSELRTITQDVSNQYKRTLLRGGELLICLVGQPGQVAVAPKSLAGANIARQVGLIRLRADVDAEFLSYFLQSPDGQQRLGTYTGGSVQQVINLSDLRTVLVPIPSLAEQQRIVGVLDEAFAGIATAQANAEKNFQNASALFESHLHAVFTQGGTGWIDKTLGDVCELFQGLCVNAKTKHLLVEKSDLPLLRIKDLRNNSVEQFVAPSGWPKNARVQESEIIYTRTGQIGLVFRGRAGVLHNNCFKVKPKHMLNDDYLFWWLQSPVFRARITMLASKAAQPDITHSLFKVQPIRVPPRAYQDAAIGLIDRMLEETKRLEGIYQQKLAALAALQKSLLNQAFTGQL